MCCALIRICVKGQDMETRCWRVEAHPRGHVAACNGRVELVGARIESCAANIGESCLAEEVQAMAEERAKEKASRLQAFQREVRVRVQRKEQEKQRQMSETSKMLTQRKVRKEAGAVRLGRRRKREQHYVQEDEVVAVVTSETQSAAQRARLSLLAASHPHSSLEITQSCPTISSAPLQPSSLVPHTSSAGDKTLSAAHPPLSLEERGRGKRMVQCLPPPAGLEEVHPQSQAQQCRMFHKLYSALERETTRVRRSQQALREEARRRREEQELQRRAVEEEMEMEDSLCSVSSSREGLRQRMEEWEETLALETRRHRLQTARETERFVEALRARLRERLNGSNVQVAPLCSCAPSLWDCDPMTCANNCPFYKNPKAFARALANLLASLKFT